MAGVIALGFLGLLTRTLVGETPVSGWRTNRALEAATRGETERAARELSRLADEHPEDTGAWLRAGRALVADGRARDGASCLERAIALDPSSITARYELAKALLDSWLDDDAERALQALLERAPDHAEGHFLAAALAAGRGDVSAAAARYARALEAGGKNPDRYRNEPRFDGVRADPRFLAVARDRRFESAFSEGRP